MEKKPEQQKKPIVPPSQAPGRTLGRDLGEAAVELIPGGGLVTALFRVTHPPLADKLRGEWEKTLSERTNEHSSRLERQELALQDLRSFLTARTARKEAGQAGLLSFFRTGMLASLEKFADGRGDAATQKRLAQQLDATAPEVDEIISSLTAARDMLSGEAEFVEFAHRLDDVLYGKFGKVGIRERIQEIIAADIRQPYIPELARQICMEIGEFNQRVIALASPTRNGQATT
ncbi:hypothetical protein [Rhizobium leguminosarum]|uniref:hypothetical protein n=1 Tax=Rhizobium leguminosarum TaxID=384 RepID=UPI003F9506A7